MVLPPTSASITAGSSKPPKMPKTLRADQTYQYQTTVKKQPSKSSLQNDGGRKLSNMGGQKNGFEIQNYLMQYELEKQATSYHISQQNFLKNKKKSIEVQRAKKMKNQYESFKKRV